MSMIEIGEKMYLFGNSSGKSAPHLVISAHGGISQSAKVTVDVENYMGKLIKKDKTQLRLKYCLSWVNVQVRCTGSQGHLRLVPVAHYTIPHPNDLDLSLGRSARANNRNNS